MNINKKLTSGINQVSFGIKKCIIYSVVFTAIYIYVIVNHEDGKYFNIILIPVLLICGLSLVRLSILKPNKSIVKDACLTRKQFQIIGFVGILLVIFSLALITVFIFKGVYYF